MSAINNNHIYDGAIYRGHALNGVMPFNRLIFHHNNHVTIKYIDTSTGDTLETDSVDLEYNRDDNLTIFELPYIDDAITIPNYTDQYIQADKTKMLKPTLPLGLVKIETYNDRNVLTYNLAPIKTTGTIYVNYIYNHHIIFQSPITGTIGSVDNDPLQIPGGYSFVDGQAYINDFTFQYYPQYKNVLITKASD